MTSRVTAIVLTYNEQQHIARCITSLTDITDRIVVVDSFSNDQTVEVAARMGADVYQNTWTTHAGQFQWALDNCEISTEWTLRIDADEYLEPELQESIRRWCAAPQNGVNGLYLKRKIVFLDQPITHGFFYPLKILRMWKTGHGRMEQRRMDEHIVLSSPQTSSLEGDLVDHNLNNLSWWISKHDRYAELEVEARVESVAYKNVDLETNLSGQAARKRWLKEKAYSRLPSTLRATFYFLYRYILGRGFLDGKAGFYFHFLQAYWYRTLVEAKMFELEQRAKAQNMTPYDLLVSEGILKRPPTQPPQVEK